MTAQDREHLRWCAETIELFAKAVIARGWTAGRAGRELRRILSDLPVETDGGVLVAIASAAAVTDDGPTFAAGLRAAAAEWRKQAERKGSQSDA